MNGESDVVPISIQLYNLLANYQGIPKAELN